ncbi:MAG: tRNA lysidine(34) synthetase TilS [Salinarimonadaceae bacterium]|nr:MAG: tRNA lysidine(34) synthetase TilS [Salinarimonadaceae bacterium]
MNLADPHSPLTADEAAALFRAVSRDGETTCLLAVSGGPDSTALMRLAADAAPLLAPLRFIVATVDHGLREAARAEAEGVVAQATALRMEARLLRWEAADRPARGVQQAAREARYRLLMNCARECGSDLLATAHTLDDQAETVLMRLAAGSGLDGLAAMARRSPVGDIVVARPFLAIPKSRLVATCRARGWAYVEDPSNQDPAYTRPRLRGIADALAAEGLTAERLARLARRAASARDALDDCARRCFARASQTGGGGAGVTLDGRVLAGEPFEIVLRVLGLALDAVADGGESGRAAAYGPRLRKLETLCEALTAALAAGAPMPGRTLAGARFALDAQGRVRVTRAPARKGGSQRGG